MPNGEPFLTCAKIEAGYLVRYASFADFVVSRDGAAIQCARKEPQVSILTLRHLLLDSTLPMALSLLGKQALHATAIVTHAGACAFVGPTGSGKSTLATSFLLAGYPPLADDCLVLGEWDGISAIPAYPGVRLWQDSLEALSGDTERPTPVAEYTPKTRLLGGAMADFPREPQRLVRIYRVSRQDRVSGAAAAPKVEAMSARESVMELLSSAFLLDPTASSLLARQFLFLRRVLSCTPVKRLLIPTDFSRLPDTRDAILADLGPTIGDAKFMPS
jgi:hypothetical protein